MEDTIPNLNHNSLPISCKPNVLALVETHIGGQQAQNIPTILNYGGHTKVDAQGFSGGI